MITYIWIAYAAANLFWQWLVSCMIKGGGVEMFKQDHPMEWEKVLNLAMVKGLTPYQAFRRSTTIGLNLYLLPACVAGSVLVLIFS